MAWDRKAVTIKERLSRLEDELDQLISLQEKATNLCKVNIESRDNDHRNVRVQKHDHVNITTHSRSLSNKPHACSLSESSTAQPLSEISKFLQHINLNLSKGTQAVTKLANFTMQQNCKGDNSSKYHDSCLKQNNTINSLAENKTVFGKAQDEDTIFKEIREEKDKRQRAENQVKKLKDEIKKNKTELQQKSDSEIHLLQTELKQTVEKLEEAKCKLDKCYQDQRASEILWPFQYDNVCKELQDERFKREEAERNIHTLQEKLQKQVGCIKENCKIQKSVNWLSGQNQHLTCLITKLNRDIEAKQIEILTTNQNLEHNLRKMRQLICVCEKLRNHLIMMKEKNAEMENNLRYNLLHCQKLSESLLNEQRKSEEFKRRQIHETQENQKLSEHVKNITSCNEGLQSKLNDISKIMRKQNDIISCQSEQLNNKTEQLRLSCENIKLQSQKINELEDKLRTVHFAELENMQLLTIKDMKKIKLELDSEKEKVLIKDKIIESHIQTTIKLKTMIAEKGEEINLLKRDISKKEQKLLEEKNANDQLLTKIKSLECCKQKLKQTIKELEDELEASSEQTKRLDKIEEQVREKQKQLEEHNALLNKEKQDILDKLGHATQQLANTSVEFEQERSIQDQNIIGLKNQLHEKEGDLKEALERISNLSQELKKASEHVSNVEKSYEEKMERAFDAWQKTMEVLKS